MNVKTIVDENFQDYKKPGMFIAFSRCSFKCEKDADVACCHNSPLAKSKDVSLPAQSIIERYINNPITSSVICGGLEPLDDFKSLKELLGILRIRFKNNDDFVIYTGYNKEEIEEKIKELKKYKNIIMKYGRFIPNQQKKYDEVLGICLSSGNQFGEKIS